MLSLDELLIYNGEDIWSHNSEYAQIQKQDWKERSCWCSNLGTVLKGSNTSQVNQQEAILNVLCGWIHDHVYEGHEHYQQNNYFQKVFNLNLEGYSYLGHCKGIAIIVAIYSHYSMFHLQSTPVNLFFCITSLGNHKMFHLKWSCISVIRL